MSIRTRLLLLVMAATLLPSFLVGVRFLIDREREVDVAIGNLSTSASDLAARLHERILGTFQLQYGLVRARDLDATDPKTCSAFLSGVREEYPQYTGILTIQPDGRLFCDSLGTGRELDLRDRRYFREASASGRVALEPVFGRLTGSAVLQIAYPAHTTSGDLKFVLLASLNLEKFVQDRTLRGMEILVLGLDGTVLAWSPEQSRGSRKGSSIRSEPLFAFAADNAEGRATEMTGADGTPQVWAVAGSQSLRDAGLHLLVGQSKGGLVAAANKRFIQDMVVLVVVAVFLFLGVWLLAELGIRRQVTRIGVMATQLGSGDLQARIPPPYPRGELGGLMKVFNATAESLERQHSAIGVLNQQLLHSQKMDAVGQLTGGVAHDFNNILMIIMANIDALEEEQTLEPLTIERLEAISDATRRAADLTRQLLAFSRKQALRPTATNLNDLVTTTGTLLRRTLGAQIEIKSILAEDIWTVEVDRAQLESALVNLCINARDAMPDGGRLLVETSNVILDGNYVARHTDAAVGDYVMLAVSDTGTGIAPELLGKVFEPFFTTKGVGQGTGLGLSMVYGFIKQSRGHVDIDSELGKGTSIKLYLPRRAGAHQEVVVRQSPPMPRGTERIMVVEDEPQVCADVVHQLQSLGYEVAGASDGTAALAALEGATLTCDLLLTDVVMPGLLNGKALADEVARRWPETKIIFMSGYSEGVFSQHDGGDTGVRLLNKPFRKSDLAQVVRQTLDGAAGPEQMFPKAA